MRRILLRLAVPFLFLLLAEDIYAATVDDRLLTLDDIQRIETQLKMPVGAKPLASYNRVYSVRIVNGRQMIEGDFRFDKSISKTHPAKVEIREERSLPIMDGGCNIVHILYDWNAARVVSIFCNGIA